MNKKYLLLAFIVMLFASCEVTDNETINGNGDVQSKEVSLSDYQSVETNGAFEIVFVQDSVWLIEVEAESNILPLIEVYTTHNKLVIENKENYTFRLNESIKVTIHHQGIGNFQLNGAGNADIGTMISTAFTCGLSGSGDLTGNIQATTIDFNISGTGSINSHLTCDEVESSISGTGSLKFDGQATSAIFTVSGTGNIDAKNLPLETCRTKVSGIANESITVSKTFYVTVSGIAVINYWGSPQIVSNYSGTVTITGHN